jgi:hypothetical protein
LIATAGRSPDPEEGVPKEDRTSPANNIVDNTRVIVVFGLPTSVESCFSQCTNSVVVLGAWTTHLDLESKHTKA